MQSMTYEDFQKYVKKFNDNFRKKITSFKITCKACGSEDVHVLHNKHEISGGSEYTGCWTSQEESLVFKCASCGQADIIIGTDEEIKEEHPLEGSEFFGAQTKELEEK